MIFSHTQLDLFLVKLMHENSMTTQSVPAFAARLICNLRFTDIYPTGGSNGEHQDLIDRLADKARAYRMKVSTEKNTIIINSTNNLSEDLA